MRDDPQNENPPTGEDPSGTGADCKLEPGLYVVATPIGNLRDITLRALDTLRACQLILCEDTRVSRKLLSHYGIHKALQSYHDHSRDDVEGDVERRVAAGESVAIISDAGTPLVSDPGFALVSRLREKDLPVYAVPGPSALTAALSVAGLATDRILFAGFLPAKSGARRAEIDALKDIPATLVFYEAPHRLARTLDDLAEVLGPRAGVFCRELTKKFEDHSAGSLEELAARVRAQSAPKGEIVILVSPPNRREVDSQELDAELAALLASESVKSAAQLAADKLGVSRKRAYDAALKLKAGSGNSDAGD